MPDDLIKSIEMFIQQITKIQEQWTFKARPWFRGQRVDKPLLPRLFREYYDENEIVQIFRLKSPMFYKTPIESAWDKWLCLMQHSGAPTRLLDWTEGALIALYFAIHKFTKDDSKPVVWMMNPLIMNQISFGRSEYPLSFSKDGIKHFQFAFDKGVILGTQNPVAIYPVEVHSRMTAQKSCFTIHAWNEESIEEIFSDTPLVKENFLIKLKIDINCCKEMLALLQTLGISHSTLFPDLDGLGFELSQN